MRHSNPEKRSVLGVLLISLGAILLLKNFNIIPSFISNVVFSWQFFMMVVGAFFYYGKQSKATGSMMMLVGAVFMFLKIFHLPFLHLTWPIVFVAIGLTFIFQRRRKSTITDEQRMGSYYDDSLNAIDEIAIMGGTKRTITSAGFSGGKITAVFGGSEINIAGSELADGYNVLDVLAIFGGTTIVVPSHWDVRIEMTSIFGGFSDKRIVNPAMIEPGRVLVIKGLALFGGGEVKSY